MEGSGQPGAAAAPRRVLRPAGLLRLVIRALSGFGRAVAGTAHGLARVLAGLVSTAVSLLLALMVLAGLIAWRAGQPPPLDVSWLAGRAAAAALAQSGKPPMRVRVGRAEVSWGGWRSGPDAPVRVVLEDVRADADPEQPAADAPEARGATVLGRLEAAYQPTDLFAGRLQPIALEVERLRLHLVRDADGSLRLVLPGGATLAVLDEAAGDGGEADPGASAAHPAAGKPRCGPLAAVLGPLRLLRVRDAAVELTDARSGGTVWRVAGLDAEVRRTAAGPSGATAAGGRDAMTGWATARLGMGTVEAPVRIEVEASGSGEASTLRARAVLLSPVQPIAFAQAAPALTGFAAAMDAPVTAEAEAELDGALRPRSVRLRAQAGPGRLTLPGAAAAPGVPVPFTEATAEAVAEWDEARAPAAAITVPERHYPARLRLERLRVVLPSSSAGAAAAASTTLRLSGAASWDAAAGRIRGDLSVEADRVLFADLPTLWPQGVARGAREWVTENITSGVARDARFQFRGDASEDLSDAVLAEASGQLIGENLTVHWLRPVPPATAARGVLRLLNPDVLEVGSITGRQGALRVEDGTVRITELSARDQVARIALDIKGALPEVLRLLRHPRLRLLSRHPVPIEDPAGSAAVRLQVRLPLVSNLDFDDVAVETDAQLDGVRLRGIAAGRDLERGTLQLHATNSGMQVTGQATVAGIPARLKAELDFRGGPPGQVLQRVEASGRVDPRQLPQFGLDFAPDIASGTAAVDMVYSQFRDRTGDVTLRADLADTVIATPVWAKPRGQAATLGGRLILEGDRLVGVDDLRLRGAGAQADAQVDLQDGRLRAVFLDRAVLGRTEGSGSVAFPLRPGEALRVQASGPVLDLAQHLTQRDAFRRSQPPARPSRPARPGPPYVIDVRFGRALLPGGGGGTGRPPAATQAVPLLLHAESDGRRLLRARLDAGAFAQGSVAPDGAGGRRLHLQSTDLGLLLRALDVTDVLAGGTVRLDGRFDDSRPGAPLTGEATVSDFRLFEAVIAGKLLQAMTLYGVLDALRGPGLAFSRAVVPFTYTSPTGAADGILDVREARAFSSSLGVTAQGRVDLARDRVDMRGTVVPAYFFNSLLGRVPLVGRLFSPERGGGVLAAEFAVRGNLDDPSVSVNPLATLTPGFLRGLFRLFD